MFQKWTFYSGTPLFNQWTIAIFNFATQIHITIQALFDSDLEQNYILSNPQLYRSGPANEYMSTRILLRWIFNTIIHIFCIFWLCLPLLQVQGMESSAFSGLMWNRAEPGDGEGDFLTFGTTIYNNVIIVLGLKVCLSNYYL